MITSNLQFAKLVNEYFRCHVSRITDEGNGKGAMGFKLIVGWKKNVAYDPNADSKKPGLDPASRELERNRENPREPDIRIIWVKPNETVDDLRVILQRIKEDINKTKVIPKKEEKVTGINHKSDADIAAEVADGKYKVEASSDDMDEIPEDYFDKDVNEPNVDGSEDEIDSDDGENYLEDEEDRGSKVDLGRKPDHQLGEVLDSINQLVDGFKVLNHNVGVLDGRITKMEKLKPKKKKGKVGKPEKKTQPEQEAEA